MFTRLLDRLRGPAPAPPVPEVDAPNLIGALMIRVAEADATLTFEELRDIDRLLAAAFGLGPLEAARLRAASMRLAEVLPATETLGPVLHETLSPEQRDGLRDALRQVAQADGAWDPREARLIEAVGDLLQRSGPQE